MRKKNSVSRQNYSVKHKKCETTPSQNLSIIEDPATLKKYYDYLPTPVKSEHDFREYKVIRLQNGITALLISSLQLTQNNKENLSESSDTKQDVLSVEEESNSDSSDNSSSSENDENYKIKISKQESFKKITLCPTDKKTDELASASICVGVGSYSDPDDFPGLAHLMEHLIFTGSSKYPEENEFDSFIASHGGNNKAATETEKTFFYFEIHQEVLQEALDRLANMISEPLFNLSTITKELHSVDGEFFQVIQDDVARKKQLISLLGKENHPIRKFLWGNMLSLKEKPSEKNLNLQKELFKFHKEYYCPDNMTLTVGASLPVEKLEVFVVQSFKNIIQAKNRDTKKIPLLTECPFDSKYHCKILKAIPIQQINNLEIIWTFPPIKPYYKTKPAYYLSTLIGDEGYGSLLSYLRQKLWALDLSCGNQEGGIYNTSTYCLFQLSLNLTEEGYFHLFDVLTAVFQYIKMIQKMGPVKRIFDEIQVIEDNIFKWQDLTNIGTYVEHLCNNMQDFKPEDYIIGSQLLLEYKAEIIKEFLNFLSPENATIILFSKHEDKTMCDAKEPWFQIPYCIYNLSPQWIKAWSNLAVNPLFYLPIENKFIAKNFAIKTSEVPQTFYPVKILDTAQSRLWYKKDFKFLVPKAYVYFHLITPLVNQTPQNCVLFDLFKHILEYNLKADTFNAISADLLFHIMSLETGMIIYLRGFNDKLFLLFETIVNHLVNFNVSEETFSVFKKRIMQNYHNIFIKPDKLARELQFSIIKQTFWTSVDKRALLTTVTKDMLTSFVNHLKSCLFLEGLIQGNVTVEEALMYEKILCEKLKCKLLPKAAFPEIRIFKLPEQTKICKVRNFSKADSNSVIINYYQYGPGDIFSTCVMALLVSFMQEPCFNYLRSRQQLGYHVECCCSNVSGIIGFTIMIRTLANKCNTDYIDEQIEAFLNIFGENLKLLKKNQYDEVINILINTKLSENTDLEDEVYGNWNEILTQNYLFDRLNVEAHCLKTITLSDLKRFFKKLRPDLNDFTKLSVQIVGDGKEEHISKNSTNKKRQGHNVKSKRESNFTIAPLSGYLNHTRDIRINQTEKQQREVFEYEINTLSKDDSMVYITDINIFKQNLMLYPITRLLH